VFTAAIGESASAPPATNSDSRQMAEDLPEQCQRGYKHGSTFGGKLSQSEL
jgi:hypothetical protein